MLFAQTIHGQTFKARIIQRDFGVNVFRGDARRIIGGRTHSVGHRSQDEQTRADDPILHWVFLRIFDSGDCWNQLKMPREGIAFFGGKFDMTRLV
jgi:hypothetical protein